MFLDKLHLFKPALKRPRQTTSKSEKKFDYVIVVPRNLKESPRHYSSVVKFLNYLQVRGIETELDFGNIFDNLYVKLRVKNKFVKIYADIYHISIRKKQRTNPLSLIHLEMFKTPLSLDQSMVNGGEPTSSDRITILYIMLNEAKFGESDEKCKYGIDKLLRIGAVKDAYPLHDGPAKSSTNEEFLNDRQKLLKYWANFSLWYKEQPLNLIEKYFGTEVAFYFAWLGFYNMMLIPASLVGLICFLFSLTWLLLADSDIVTDVCNSELPLCPRCVFGNQCRVRRLRMECEMTSVFVIFDNNATTFFAVFMSFWATIFINLWKQKEYVLKQRWNVVTVVDRTQIRPLYKEKAKYLRKSQITGELEPYTPAHIQAFYNFLSFGTCLFLIVMLLLVVCGVTIFRICVATLLAMSDSNVLKIQSPLIVPAAGAILQVIFIKSYGEFYAPISEWLTNIENPRTQFEFDNSVIHKRYFLAFANNYAGLFYIAFFKGRFYSPSYSDVLNPRTDLCNVHGCFVGLCIQLFVMMLLKSLAGNILIFFKPKFKSIFMKKGSRKLSEPQWEEEYKLIPARRYLLTTEFLEMIIQYGFVTLFVAAFPLAPLCALINNCLELRLDAVKLVERYRRPVPRKYSGIGTWGEILQTLTHISIATNAFVLSFTSHIVPKMMYRFKHGGSLKGYVNSSLSIFDLKDTDNFKSKKIIGISQNSTICYYKGLHYPPNHPLKYEKTDDYWFELGMRLVCVIVFEQIIMILNGLLSYFIAKEPKAIKQISHHYRNLKIEEELEKIHSDARKKWQAKTKRKKNK